MPKIHYFQRYSSPENAVTNNTLQLFSQIYSHSPERAAQLLSTITGEPIDIGVHVLQQTRAVSSVPDGQIVQRSFKVVIEAKVDAFVDYDQLVRHSASFNNETQQILLLLTRQALTKREITDVQARIYEAHRGVTFASITYEGICDVVRELTQEHEGSIYEIVQDYIEYCNDMGLFDQSAHLMRIVPCGISLELNQQHGIYFQPSDRGYTPHSYVAIYARKAVRAIWAIEAVFDVDMVGGQLRKICVQGEDTEAFDDRIISIVKLADENHGWNIRSGHRFFCGYAYETTFRKTSSGGIQGARFMNLRELLGDYADTATIAERLKTVTWA